jgi:hypothetical protein
MDRKRTLTLIAALLSCVLAPAAFAGGWAIITLSDFPDYTVAGKPLQLVFAVRQHGQTLLNNLKPSVTAKTNGGLVRKMDAVPTRSTGEYTATLTLPEAGEWTITIASGFNDSATTLPTLKVIGAGAPVPLAFSPATRGVRLFTAKGCVGCHRHLEVNPERQTDAKFDLTAKRFPPDYLKKFLADPSIKPAEMPKLNLKDEEIDALAAFINKNLKKSEVTQK